MDFIKPYIDSILNIWRDSTPPARIGIGLLALLCVVTIAGVGYWSVQPDYVVLVSQSDGEKVDQVIDALDKAGIAYQLSGAGGNVLVDRRDFAKAGRLARNVGVSTSSSAGGMGIGGSMLTSPTERRMQARIALQTGLANTIKKISVVNEADVHLNIPERGPFERKTSKPSASVLLTLLPDSHLSEEQATSIASFVAFAVEDLAPEDVQITDKEGNSFTVPDERTNQISSQVEYVAEAESKLARKAESQLLQFVGFGNANVEVALDMTFTQGSKKITKYDAEGAVPNEEELISESTKNIATQPEGAAGVASNLQSRRRGSENIESKTENIKTKYMVPITEETQANSTPLRNFMSVSVMINSQAQGVLQEDGTMAPGMEEKITALVKNAVGFREDTDTISVQFMPFAENVLSVATPAPGFDWTKVTEIIEKASLAIAAMLAFFMGVLLLRKYRPVADKGNLAPDPQMDRTRMESVNELSKLIKDHPEVFTQIVRSWSGVDREQETGDRQAA